MSETVIAPDHLNAIVEKFWAENPELKRRIFRAWYSGFDVHSSLNNKGRDAVSLLLEKGSQP